MLIQTIVLMVALAAQTTDQRIALEVLRHNHLGVAHLERYEYRLAVEELKKAAALKPDYLPALVNLGLALYYDQNYSAAAQPLQAALKLDPRQPQAHFMMGLLHSKESRNAEALQEFEQALAVRPDDAATHYNIGLLHLREKHYELAIRNFEKVLSLEPQHLSALYNLGMAYMRSGRRDEAQKILARLAELKGQEQVGGPMGSMGLQYGDEGRFAVALNPVDYPFDGGAEKPGVRFTDVTSAAGIAFRHAGGSASAAAPFGAPIPSSVYSRRWAEQNLVPSMGSGAVFFDYNGDGRPDLYLVNCGREPGSASNALYRNNTDGTFTDVTREAGVGHAGHGMGAAVGDYNNDGYPDLYLTNYGRNVLYRNDKNGRFSEVTTEAGVAGAQGKWSLSAAFFDYDHDGDLDLYAANFVDLAKAPSKSSLLFPGDFSGQPNLLFRNNGNGTFTEVAGQARVAGDSGRSSAVLFADFNESRDIDFLVLNYDAPAQLFSNNRDGSFAEVAPQVKLAPVPACFGATAGDLDKDGFTDFFFPASDGSSAGRLFRSQAGQGFTETRLVPRGFSAGGVGGKTGWAASLFDYDNDGALDILSIADRCRLFRNLGQGQFVDVTSDAGLDGLPPESARSIALADYDSDGDVDVLITRNGGSPLLLQNTGGNRNRFLKVRLLPQVDNRSAIGSKVEVRSGSLWQKLEVTGNAGYLSQGGTEVLVGLGQRQSVDSVRVLWPTGVLQAEISPPVDSQLQVQQVNRKGTSCPILYAWDGQDYNFVTDFLGGSAFGSLVAPGRYNATDTDEYVLLTPSQLRAKEGRYSIKMNDQLEEVLFIDEVKLLAIDHPSELQVYPNERLMPGPPFPEFRLQTARNARPPLRAVDDRGRDVLPSLTTIDRSYPENFALLPFKGYAEKHSLVLDFGDLSQERKVLLLLTAWIDYADSSSNLAAAQAGVQLIPPYLEVLDAQGQWVTALESMGFPAGLPKTMTVDLTGKLLNAADHRIRITTSMRIYWDQILADTSAEPPDLKTVTLEAASARLGWGGYPREHSPDGRMPKTYDYSRREQWAPWKSHAGNYTRYGEVRELLLDRDSMYVVMNNGDEITLDFDARQLPPLQPGWTRSFLVYAAGFGKDMDLNSAYPDTVAPWPFHGMLDYPFSGTYPADARRLQYLQEYNTRRVPNIYFEQGWASGGALQRAPKTAPDK